ncbi:MAG: NB-ARC domain-containing protein [Elainellaceae cyanobacterium]
MPRSLRVDSKYFDKIRLALRRNEFLNQRALAEELRIGKDTVSKFFNGKPVDRANFEDICNRLGLDSKEIAASIADSLPDEQPSQPFSSEAQPNDRPALHQDWGEAPEVSTLYGRTNELTTLNHWITQDRCRLVAILGMGGMGKTTLAVKLAEQIQDEFEYVIWRSLRNAPPIQEILSDWFQFVSEHQDMNLPETVEGCISRLVHHLRTKRCLLILDNLESILQEGNRAGQYRPEYEVYGQLLRVIGETAHQSCLLLTSREKPKGFDHREGQNSPVCSLQLAGLATHEGQKVVQFQETLGGTDEDWDALVQHYAGNPLALKIVAPAIQDFFEGNLAQFLQFLRQGTLIFDDIRSVLERQFNRLTSLEQEVMYWLAINREPVSLTELQADLIHPVTPGELLETLKSLQRRSLLEKTPDGFTQQPVVMEYVVEQFIQRCYQEIVDQRLEHFRTHALIKARTQSYIRDIQIRLILNPILEKLLTTFHEQAVIDFLLNQQLDALRGKLFAYTGYAAGNIINLLGWINSDLSDRDFSDLHIAQAYLPKAHLHRTNFNQSTFYQSTFAETFGKVISATFSPDGQLLAIGDSGCEIQIWNVSSGQKLTTLRGHDSWAWSLAFSPDGSTIAGATDTYIVKLWDVKSGQCLQTLKGPPNLINSITFSSDSRTILPGKPDAAIQLWNVEHPEQRIYEMQGYSDLPRSIAFSPDGQTLAHSTREQTIKLWNMNTGECYLTIQEHTALVKYPAFSPDGKLLADTSLDQTIKLWNAKTGEFILSLAGHTNSISNILFSPDGRYIASSSFDQTVKLWDIYKGECIRTFSGHSNWQLLALAFSPDGKILASGGGEHAVKLWDTKTGRCIKTLQGYTNAIPALALSLNHKMLASAHEDKTIRLWNLETGEAVKSLEVSTDLTWAVAFAPTSTNQFLGEKGTNAQVFASVSSDCTARLWDLQTGLCLRILRHNNWVSSVDFHPNGQHLVTGSYDQTIKLWDIYTGECIKTLRGHKSAVANVAFTPDAKWLISGSFDKTIRVWDIDTDQCLHILQGHSDRIWRFALSSDGQSIASCSYDKTIKLWNLATGECIRTFTGHQGAVASACFRANNQQLVSAGFDQTIKIWDINTGECLNTLTGHTGGVLFVLCPDFRHLDQALKNQHLMNNEANSVDVISSSMDGMLKMWNIQKRECLRTLQAPRPYEGMQIAGVTGLTNAQISTLCALGAVTN